MSPECQKNSRKASVVSKIFRLYLSKVSDRFVMTWSGLRGTLSPASRNAYDQVGLDIEKLSPLELAPYASKTHLTFYIS